MNFNPRSREGSDRAASSNKEKRYQISIHAPARGATRCSPFRLADHNTFQSTLPRGERLLQASVLTSIVHFNPRSREGSDHGRFTTMETHGYFNPRSREGSDEDGTKGLALQENFNPRSREGSDCVRWIKQYVKDISIHAPARGATHSGLLPFRSAPISIHAPARGATYHMSCDDAQITISIHAPARGATSILSKIHPMFLTISHNASSFSSFPFHSFLPHLLNSSTFCALFQVRISRAFSVYYRFAPKKSTPDL